MLLPSARPLHQDTTQPLHYRPRSQSIFQTNEKSCLDALGFFFLHLLLISPKAFPEYQSVWGRDVAQCAVSSAGPLWGGRARPGPGADLGSAQEAELTPPLLSYSPSAKHRVSWVNKNPTSKEFQVLPSDSKKVAKTTARLLWSGGPEVGGGSRRGGRGGGGRALAAGVGEARRREEVSRPGPGWPDCTGRQKSKQVAARVWGPWGPIVLHEEDTLLHGPVASSGPRQTAHAGAQGPPPRARLDPCASGYQALTPSSRRDRGW